MARQFYSPQTPMGRIRLATRLPERLIGEMDVAVGYERMRGHWLSRSDAISEALRFLLETESLQGVDAALVHSAVGGPRRSITMHLEWDPILRMRVEISEARDAGTIWGEWEVLAVAIRRFLDNGGFA